MTLTKSSRSIIESRCESCDRVWTGSNAGIAARAHAEHSGHRVRVTRVIVLVYNIQNGKAKHDKQTN